MRVGRDRRSIATRCLSSADDDELLLCHNRPARYITRYNLSCYFALDIRHRSTVGYRISRFITYHVSAHAATRKLRANIVLADYYIIIPGRRKLSLSLAQSRVGSAAAADSDGDCVSSRRADRGTGSRRVPILVDLGRNARGRRSVEYTCRRRRKGGRGGRRRQKGILFADARRRCTTTEVHAGASQGAKKARDDGESFREEAGNKPRMALTRAAGTCAVNAGS